jgi:peptidoglycan/xylan/chitin deacetylase (PgdA/CDA1 family)
MIPHRTPFFLPILYPSLTWRLPAGNKELFLTFDDGPVSGPTDFVLEELKKFSVIATFFCIGDNIRKHPDVFRKIVEGGHAIGNHTYNHLNGWRTSPQEYIDNIKKFEQQLSIANCKQSTVFRPPYGKVTRSQIKRLAHYKIIMWDVLSQDYNKNLSPEKCLQNTIEATRPGSIIVFHDSFKAERNLRFALPRFVSHFHDKGYTFKAISL